MSTKTISIFLKINLTLNNFVMIEPTYKEIYVRLTLNVAMQTSSYVYLPKSSSVIKDILKNLKHILQKKLPVVKTYRSCYRTDVSLVLIVQYH